MIRDADKLEKYLSVESAFRDGAIIAQTLSIEDEGPVTEAAIQSILRNRKVHKKHIHSLLDYHLLQLSWIFEVSYPVTFQRIADSGAKFIGQVDPDDYTFDESRAIIDGKFIGLPIDEDNESDLTDERLAKWVAMIKDEL